MNSKQLSSRPSATERGLRGDAGPGLAPGTGAALSDDRATSRSEVRPGPWLSVNSARHSIKPLLLGLLMLLLAGLACSGGGQTEIIYVTATFPGGQRVLTDSPTPDEPTNTPLQPTPNPTRPLEASLESGVYTVQPGDTLAVIANRAGTSLEVLLQVNGLTNADVLEVGQVLVLPDAEGNLNYGPSFKMMPDSEVIYSPGVADFNLAEYLKLKDGFIRAYSAERGESIMTALEMVDEVAKNYSISPRLLLALLEYRGGWLSQVTIPEDTLTYPFGLLEPSRTELYSQLLDTADLLAAGYYGWKYRRLQTLIFDDGRSVVLHPTLNPGTVALQYFFSKYNSVEQWRVDVSDSGFLQTYMSLFGDPFLRAYEPLLPPGLSQPEMALPFPDGETWYYTGGPHGGYDVGSAWASIDFAPPAPPDELINLQGFCYVSPNYATAVAPGIITRSGGGFVILDLDGDGNEWTGWTVVYLHLADNENLIEAGTRVNTGDKLGQPSCDGGFSSATHLHIGRRYNGEWIPADCSDCPKDVPSIPFVMSGWTVRGYSGQEYQGYMENAQGEFRRAEQGRDDPVNELRR